MNKRLTKDWRCEEGMEMFIQNVHGYVHVFPGDRLAMTHKNNLKKKQDEQSELDKWCLFSCA